MAEDISHHRFEIERLTLTGSGYLALIRELCGPHKPDFGTEGDKLQVDGLPITWRVVARDDEYGRFNAVPAYNLTLRGTAKLLRFCDGKVLHGAPSN
jgi:hypothetical protein